MAKEQWVNVNQAAKIMSKALGRPVHPDYVRNLYHKGRIRARALDGRTNEYLASDAQEYGERHKGKNQGRKPEAAATAVK